MTHINLYSNNGKTTVLLPTASKGRVELPPATDIGYHRRATFAALNELTNAFRHAGICHSDYWDMVKAELGITSRSEIAESVWALLSAELNACRRDGAAFQRLAASVKQFRAENPPQEVPVVSDATPRVFADPDETLSTCFVIRKGRTDNTENLIYLGEFSEEVRQRTQKHANESRCICLLFHNGQNPQSFHPETNGCSPL